MAAAVCFDNTKLKATTSTVGLCTCTVFVFVCVIVWLRRGHVFVAVVSAGIHGRIITNLATRVLAIARATERLRVKRSSLTSSCSSSCSSPCASSCARAGVL